jgi:DNA repair protein RecO (recombination protein O)
MSLFKTEAISLGRSDYSDSSQIITFYTRGHGKMHVLAKGFKRASGKQSPKAIDLLTHYQIVFVKKEHTSLHTLTDAAVQDSYPLFRSSLDVYYKASCMAELVKEFTEENDPSEELFDLFLDSLTGLATDTVTALRLLAFEIKMLNLLGYMPELRWCVNCKNSIRQLSQVRFHAKEGGALCGACRENFRDGMAVSAGAMRVSERLADFSLHRLERMKIQLPICVEIEKMLRYYISSILNKELHSWKYVNFHDNA